MQLIKFDSYDEYVEMQRVTDERKGVHGRTRRGRPRSCASGDEIDKIASWLHQHDKSPVKGICHGARHGWEVKWFRDHLPGAEVIGTDLFLKDDAEVPCIQHDFHDRREDWVGKMDFVYSNALDHAHDPHKALSEWVDQLRPGGNLFILWSPYSIDAYMKKLPGDCFGAAFQEYVSMIERYVELIDLLYCGKCRVVFAGEKP